MYPLAATAAHHENDRRTLLLALTIVLSVLLACRSPEESAPREGWPSGSGPITYLRLPEEADEAPGFDWDIMLQFDITGRVALISPEISAAGSQKHLDKSREEVLLVVSRLVGLKPEMVSLDRPSEGTSPGDEALADGAAMISFPSDEETGAQNYWIPPAVNARVREILRPWDEEFRAMEWKR